MKRLVLMSALIAAIGVLVACNPIKTDRMPDFHTTEVALVGNDLVADIQNRGVAVYDGELNVRVIIAVSLSAGHVVDRTFTVTDLWGPGETRTVVIVPDLIPQNWPDALDYPSKTLAVFLDVGDSIHELDERNNLFESRFNVPCDAIIADVVPPSITWEGLGHPFSLTLQGRFGSIQSSKSIVLRTPNGNAWTSFQNIQWDPDEITVTGTNMFYIPGGCYDLFVQCADPDPYGNRYTSNTKVICVEGDFAPDPGDDPAQCPVAIQFDGWKYVGPPADCWSEYLIRSADSQCDEDGWFCCMLNADAQGSSRCNPGYQEMTPPCCRSSEMSCDAVLRQPYGCYERLD